MCVMQRKVQCATNGKRTKVFPVYPRACLQVLQLGEARFQRTQLRPELRLACWVDRSFLFFGNLAYVPRDAFLENPQFLFHETQIVGQPLPALVKHVLGLEAENGKLLWVKSAKRTCYCRTTAPKSALHR